MLKVVQLRKDLIMFYVCKIFEFQAAHQLEEGCASAQCSDCIHGHTYKVELCIKSEKLDVHGMVLDFLRLKPFINEVMEDWDHALLLPEKLAKQYEGNVTLKKLRIFYGRNPTAEYMADLLCERLVGFLYDLGCKGRVFVEAVKVWETSKCWAMKIAEDIYNAE